MADLKVLSPLQKKTVVPLPIVGEMMKKFTDLSLLVGS